MKAFFNDKFLTYVEGTPEEIHKFLVLKAKKELLYTSISTNGLSISTSVDQIKGKVSKMKLD
jgi:hypothetical protein